MGAEEGMTLGNVLQTLRSRWYLTASGLLLTLVAVLALSARSGVYYTSVDVQLIPPEHMTVTGSPSPTDSLVALAGMVQRQVGDDTGRTEPVSPDATLTGLGVTDGTLVTLPNSGGQWNYFFDVPLLHVEAAAPTAEEAAHRRDAAVARIVTELRRVQAADGVLPLSQVTTRLVPRRAPVARERGSEARAALAAGLLGVALTCIGTVQADRLRHRRPRLVRRGRFASATNA
jgi:hypothetical protein